ncbi:NAD(P)H-binding protein [Mycobacterium sp. CVI_P3]|uniref:NAD(P)H-binding protein n=1 Tax=Mycobacterium pinniadriaticum TaxID=2994102 RepID=A0ABT3SF98_9MYCO|nr:NAD(P)H-binding protein [Mycobacterium pinniadriaticum]MCX2931734.1 NAD(P)H-binding protein [Mycobacterium pinniadriaticum]MCX2938191.1 NAD(P)H-binding protein [Mycobacterium pinniadriaticum]
MCFRSDIVDQLHRGVPLRLTVFGGTGPTGLLFVDQALHQDHEVVAFARAPSQLPQHQRLSMVLGTLDDAAGISRAILDSDAVVSLLGPGTNTADIPPLITGTRNIVAAMHEQSVQRLVAVGTPSIHDPADGKDWKIHLLVALIKCFQPAAYEAIVTIGGVVRESGLDWTIVRLPFLTNGPRTDGVNARQVGHRGGLRLSRANAAAFLLDQVTSTAYLHRAPFVTDK